MFFLTPWPNRSCSEPKWKRVIQRFSVSIILWNSCSSFFHFGTVKGGRGQLKFFFWHSFPNDEDWRNGSGVSGITHHDNDNDSLRWKDDDVDAHNLSTSNPEELVLVFLLRFELPSSPRGLNIMGRIILMGKVSSWCCYWWWRWWWFMMIMIMMMLMLVMML